VQEPNEAKLSTTCPGCGHPVTWQGRLDLDQRITCDRCGKTGTVREFVTARAQQRQTTATAEER
jgi:hypothetical protein